MTEIQNDHISLIELNKQARGKRLAFYKTINKIIFILILICIGKILRDSIKWNDRQDSKKIAQTKDMDICDLSIIVTLLLITNISFIIN